MADEPGNGAALDEAFGAPLGMAFALALFVRLLLQQRQLLGLLLCQLCGDFFGRQHRDSCRQRDVFE